jgi:hypothetical protein
MESSGEEKKIQALFSELKTADEQIAPVFARTWNRAQIVPRRMRVFGFALTGVAMLLLGALVSFALWSRYSAGPLPTNVTIAYPPRVVNPSPPHPVINATPTWDTHKPAPPRRNVAKSPRQSSAARRDAVELADNRKLAQNAKAISNWQSPTANLLTSSSDELFSSLPQLNENASELKSFLPNRPN